MTEILNQHSGELKTGLESARARGKARRTRPGCRCRSGAWLDRIEPAGPPVR